MRRRRNPTHRLPRFSRTSTARLGALLAIGALPVAALAVPAAAADTWSRTPGAGTAGGSIAVASSAASLCQWVQPTAPDPADPNASELATFDGTAVELRLQQGGNTVGLGSVAVTPGGAWSGSVVVPDVTVALPGEYDLIAQCVIDRPDLDGRRTYDFDPLTFSVIDAPPPTTITIPTELVPPITAINSNPVEVQGAQLGRPAANAATGTTAEVPTLPDTGDGTLAVALSGIGALLLGAGALWWGARYARPAKST